MNYFTSYGTFVETKNYIHTLLFLKKDLKTIMEQRVFEEKIHRFNTEMPEYCPITYSMKIIGSKWKIPILWKLMLEDGQHYNHLKRMVGNITNTMLTKSLRELEEAKLLERHDDKTVPPSVTYHLTNLGKELIYTMEGLFDWGQEIHDARES